MAKRKSKKQEKRPQFEKPSAKWYRSMRLWFFIFLGLVVLRLILFLSNKGQIQTNDIWLRLLMISLGTLLAWWYVKRREDKGN